MALTALPAMVALGLLVYHLWRTVEAMASIAQAPPVGAQHADARRNELLRRKRRRLEDLREVEFDYSAGKLDEHDRDALLGELRARVVTLMKEIDALDRVEERGARIEAELARRLGRDGA